MSFSTRLLSGSAALAIAASTPGAAQQWSPPAPTNLRVLAKATTGRELIQVMRGFTQGLGVRCQHCHVYKGEDPNDLSSFDFASDEKAPKATARVMMRMASAINDDLLKGVGEVAAAGEPKVSCYTCHRGEKRPANRRSPA
jgi:hypothetical protein